MSGSVTGPLRLGRVDVDYALALSERGAHIDLTVHPALLPDLVDWLDRRGLDFVLCAQEDVENLPSAIVSPRRP